MEKLLITVVIIISTISISIIIIVNLFSIQVLINSRMLSQNEMKYRNDSHKFLGRLLYLNDKFLNMISMQMFPLPFFWRWNLPSMSDFPSFNFNANIIINKKRSWSILSVLRYQSRNTQRKLCESKILQNTLLSVPLNIYYTFYVNLWD